MTHAQPIPPTPPPTPAQLAAIDAAIERLRALDGALLPILHAIQDEIGFVPREAVPRLALALNLSQAEVHGVIGFYHDFRSAPPGRHVLKLCRAEACQAMDAQALAERLEAKHGARFGATTADGAITLEPVYCLGNCACAPSLMLDGKTYGRVDAARLDDLVEGAR